MFFLSTISRYLLYALLIFTPLARGSVQDWAIAIIQIITLIALAFLLMEKSLTWNWKWIKTSLDIPILCLFILCLLSSVFAQLPRISLWSMILFISYLTIFYLTIHLFSTRSQLRSLINIIIGVAVFLSVFGIFKKFGTNPFPWWDYGDLKYYPDFLSATYGNHNHLAGYMEMALPLILGLLLLGHGRGKLFLISYLSLLILAALILSLSRGGWIGTLFGLTFMSVALLLSRYFRRKRLLIGMLCGFIALAFVVLASTPVVERVKTIEENVEEASFSSRVLVWSGIIRMIEDHPLLGTGPGTFSTVFIQYQPPGIATHYTMAHNDYLHFVSETGLILIAIIVWMIIAFYRIGFQKLGNPSRLIRGTTLGAMTGITAILIHSIGDFNLHIPANAILFTVLAAITVSPLPADNAFHR